MSFNPYEQNITLTASDGSTMDIPLPFFDEYVQEGVVSCINYGCQLGATVVTFVLLCLLTRSKKRSSIIFCLNVTALLLNMFRLICEVLIYTSAWFETYAYFTGDISRVSRGDFANSVLVSVMDALLQVVMEASLVTQTKVVSTNMLRWQKTAILAISIGLAVSSIGLRMAQMVLESRLIVENMPFTGYIWLQKVNTILTTTSIVYFSVVLICKLGYTIYRRKQLGVNQFSPMQIIFIMSCQTMVVPGKFLTSFHMSIANICRSHLLNLAILIRQHPSYQQRHRYLCGGFAACDNLVDCHCTARPCSSTRRRVWCSSLEQAFNIATQQCGFPKEVSIDQRDHNISLYSEFPGIGAGQVCYHWYSNGGLNQPLIKDSIFLCSNFVLEIPQKIPVFPSFLHGVCIQCLQVGIDRWLILLISAQT